MAGAGTESRRGGIPVRVIGAVVSEGEEDFLAVEGPGVEGAVDGLAEAGRLAVAARAGVGR